jgi:hypothetical protein
MLQETMTMRRKTNQSQKPYFVLILDPSKWKTQDHYAILGLSRKRYLATDDDIKRACKSICLFTLFQIVAKSLSTILIKSQLLVEVIAFSNVFKKVV